MIWIKPAERGDWLVRLSIRGMTEGASVKTLRQIFSGDEIIQLLIRLGLLGLLLIWALLLVRPFVPILAWSVVLAAALNPVFRRLSDIFGGRPKLAATILTLVNLAVVIGPATWLGIGAVDIRRRGLAGDVDRIRRRLKLSGKARATVVITRVSDKPWGLICTDA